MDLALEIALTAYGETGGEDVENQPGYYRRLRPRMLNPGDAAALLAALKIGEIAYNGVDELLGGVDPAADGIRVRSADRPEAGAGADGHRSHRPHHPENHPGHAYLPNNIGVPSPAVMVMWGGQCAAPGCTHTRFIEIHHVKEWENGATQIWRICCPCVPRAIHW